MLLFNKNSENNHLILKKINGKLIDVFLVEQAIGCKIDERINENQWKYIIKQLQKINCTIKAIKQDNKEIHLEIICPQNSFEILLGDPKLQDKVRSIPAYYERTNLFQNLGENLNDLYNSYFIQKDDDLIILEQNNPGHKKVFEIYSTKQPVNMIKLVSTGDKTFLEKPFFQQSSITLKVKNIVIKLLESFLFAGETQEFTSKKFRESKDFIIDYLHSLGYFEATVSYLLLQESDKSFNVYFIIDPGIKRIIKNIELVFDFECTKTQEIKEIFEQIVKEKIPTAMILKEWLDPLGLSVKSIDRLLKEKDKVDMRFHITQKKNNIVLENITFKNINIPTRILYWHAAKNGLIIGKNISDAGAFESGMGEFFSLLQKHTGEPPEYSRNDDDPTNMSITLTGKPQKLVRFITDTNDEEGFYKHILDFSNYNLALNLAKISKYGIAGKLFCFTISPGIRAKLASPFDMIKNAGLCLPAKVLFKHKKLEIETELKINVPFLAILNGMFIALDKVTTRGASTSSSLASLSSTNANVTAVERFIKNKNLYSFLHFIGHDLIDPELSFQLKYFNWLNQSITLNREKIKSVDNLIFSVGNNFQKYHRFSLNSASTFAASIDYKNPVSRDIPFHFLESIGFQASANHAIKFNSRDSLVFNSTNAFFFSEKPEFLNSAYKLNIPFTNINEEDKIQRLFSLQVMLLHETFDASRITSPLNFSAKLRVGFASLLHFIKFHSGGKDLVNSFKINPINFCIVLDLTEQLAYSFCIIIGPQGYSFVISKPAKNINYFPSKKLERII